MASQNNNFEEFRRILTNSEIFEGSFEWEYFPANFDIQKFQKWYIANGIFFQYSWCPIQLIFLKIKQNSASLCFKNSQLIAVNNHNALYYEGVLFSQSTGKRCHHGFNIKRNKVIDVTYLKNKKKYTEELGTKPCFYHGIFIPNEFIDSYEINNNNGFQQKPLIYEFYSKTVSIMDR